MPIELVKRGRQNWGTPHPQGQSENSLIPLENQFLHSWISRPAYSAQKQWLVGIKTGAKSRNLPLRGGAHFTTSFNQIVIKDIATGLFNNLYDGMSKHTHRLSSSFCFHQISITNFKRLCAMHEDDWFKLLFPYSLHDSVTML